MDGLMAIPSILLAVAMIALTGASLQNVIIAITVSEVPRVARLVRGVVLQLKASPFVEAALVVGTRFPALLWRHILPNAAAPLATVIGYNFGYSLTGAIMVETVFAWPGLGRLFITSIGNRDYPVLQGIFLFTAVVVVLANVATDVLYAFLDPRVRQHYERKG